MHRVSFANESFRMADDAAIALLDFAALVAQHGEAQQVVLPVVEVNGVAGERRAVIGPASQIIAEPITTDLPEPDVSDFLADLWRRSAQYSPARVLPDDETLPDLDPDL
ncbi:hypothetical protein GCM10010988_15710 [Cnuibacter physcomitrellae]|uniref:Uncharacterized protein n=1 Tax=Cnuibacter physcomitrellae TaxID=1619308 RepID=A0A1X9LPG9_9MICO|nr:hypothetical protein [Cnuibacter physcomitrellae]ARJ06342.1 hypothetical protein B5808_14815 [Cnuibacter physcomitrellae]GGI37784.1 hypothetical protein GCM10010988_15710 [Cnuibacter physcomitrellae]